MNFQDELFLNISHLIKFKNLPQDIYGVAMNLFHYYTYYKSFREIDRAELTLACVILAHKIKHGYMNADSITDLYEFFTYKNEGRNNKKTKNNNNNNSNANTNSNNNNNAESLTNCTNSSNTVNNNNNNNFAGNTTSTKTNPNIADVEMEILVFLGYDLEIEAPFKYISHLKRRFVLDRKLENFIFNIINDSYRRPLCLYFHPRTIALAATYIGLIFFNNEEKILSIKNFLQSENQYIMDEFSLCFENLYKLFDNKLLKNNE